MQKRIIQAGLQGMNQDIINPNVNSRLAYEIRNFRLNATADSNAIELTTEKGTLLVQAYDFEGNPIESPMFYGNDYSVIGHCVINEHLVLFMKGNGDNLDRIMHFALSTEEDGTPSFHEDRLGSYLGDLGFSADHMIEAVPCYESEDVVKIYWIDGINYPRIINLKHDYGYTNNAEDTLGYDPFGFYQEIGSGPYNTIDVQKTYVGGLFYAGVVQYALSFYNRNAQETPIVYVTPLNYVSHSDRGEAPNKQLGCAFRIIVKINPEDRDKFEYVRIYQIYRTSLNVTPVVKVVKDIRTDSLTRVETQVVIGGESDEEQDQEQDQEQEQELEYETLISYDAEFINTNHEGFDFDAYRILVDSEHIKPNAMSFKDHKLFFGNYSTDSRYETHSFTEQESIMEWTVDSSKFVEGYDRNFYEHKQQTDMDSRMIKGFKYNEYYKFGLQFQDRYGKWTQPFVIDSQASKNETYPLQTSVEGSVIVELPYARMKSDYGIGYIKGKLYGSFGFQEGQFVKVRPVVSFPTISERSVLCQGIVNPTVFNVTQRTQGTCFSQASWFFRPFFISNNDSDFTKNMSSYKTNGQNISNGAYVQCKHFEPLFPSDDIGGELQNMYFDKAIGDVGAARPYCGVIGMSSGDAANKYHDFYYVDHSMMTLNSPDIDFNDNIKNIDLGQYRINVVGYIPFVSNCSRQMIVAESPLFLKNRKYQHINGKPLYDQSSKMAIGFLDGTWKKDKQGRIVSRKSWFDDVNGMFKYRYRGQDEYMIYSEGVNTGAKWNQESKQYLYNTYPFQRDYLNNYGRQKTEGLGRVSVDDIDSSRILRKVLGNLKFSRQTVFYDSEHPGNFSVGDMKLFDSNENQLTKVDGKTYYGNVDQLVVTNSQYVDYVMNLNAIDPDDSDNNRINFFANVTDDSDEHNPVAKGYPIIVGAGLYPGSSGDTESVVVDYNGLTTMTDTFGQWSTASGTMYSWVDNAFIPTVYFGQYYSAKARTPNTYSQDPVTLRYKSANHIVFSMPASGDQQQLFPQPTKEEWEQLSQTPYWTNSVQPVPVPWSEDDMYYYAQVKAVDSNFDKIEEGYYDRYNEVLFMCDVYKDIDPAYLSNEDGFSNQQRDWIVCGDSYDLDGDDSVCVEFREGDTFFQRYDCLKTYPFSQDDEQSVVEIASFMVETKVNLDGRYDENRGLDDNTFVNPTNFNLINPVYSQENNFFKYRILDNELYRNTMFPTRFTWSLNKINGQEIDEWTRTNTAAFYDCDGDKGPITSLRRFNNQIYAFQDSGISRIKYNENVAISTQNGTPIELANSQTVNGIDYISETVGSQNKWSNTSTPNGIFFVDNQTPGIYRLGGGESVLSNLTKNCMQRWFESRNCAQERFIDSAWYDKNMNDVMFVFADDDGEHKSIAFNCDYNVFQSFYDYKGRIGNIGNHSFSIYGNDVHFLREGSTYNTFYGQEPSRYWISFVADAYVDGYSPSNAIYDNVWYKADVLHYYDDKDTFNYGELVPETDDRIYDFTKTTGWYETFNKIVVGNDYQYAENKDQTKCFDFIKKFRTWRVPIPRQSMIDGRVGRERMRNSWLRVRLENTSPSYDKMVLRDIYVDSFY